MNLTPVFALARALAGEELARRARERLRQDPARPRHAEDEGLRWETVRRAVPTAIGIRLRVRTYLKRMRAFLAASPQRCEELRGRVAATATATGAGRAVRERDRAALRRRPATCWRPRAGRAARAWSRSATTLRRMVGDVDAEAMLTGVTAADELASLGLLTGLAQAGARRDHPGRRSPARTGTADRTSSSCPIPRPGEDPGWIDAQLAGLRDLRTDTAALLARQERAREAAWARFAARYPGKTAGMRERGAALGRRRARPGDRPLGGACARSGCCARSSCGPGS